MTKRNKKKKPIYKPYVSQTTPDSLASGSDAGSQTWVGKGPKKGKKKNSLKVKRPKTSTDYGTAGSKYSGKIVPRGGEQQLGFVHADGSFSRTPKAKFDLMTYKTSEDGSVPEGTKPDFDHAVTRTNDMTWKTPTKKVKGRKGLQEPAPVLFKGKKYQDFEWIYEAPKAWLQPTDLIIDRHLESLTVPATIESRAAIKDAFLRAGGDKEKQEQYITQAMQDLQNLSEKFETTKQYEDGSYGPDRLADSSDQVDIIGSIWEQFTSQVATKFDNTPGSSVAESAVGITGDVLGAAGSGAMTALEFYQSTVVHPRNHFIAATAAFFDSGSGSPWDWGDSWSGTYGIDAGQAVAASTFNQFNMIMSGLTNGLKPPSAMSIGDINPETGEPLTPEEYQAASDRLDDDLRDKGFGGNSSGNSLDSPEFSENTYRPLQYGRQADHDRVNRWGEHDLTGQLLSTYFTLGIEIVGDPFVYAGKGIKAVRVGVQGSDWVQQSLKSSALTPDWITKNGGSNGVLQVLENVSKRLAGSTDMLDQQKLMEAYRPGSWDELTWQQKKRAKTRDKKAARFSESLKIEAEGIASTKDVNKIIKMPMVAGANNPTYMAGIMADMKDPEDVIDVMKYLASKRDTSEPLARLLRKYPSIGEEVRNYSSFSRREGPSSPANIFNGGTGTSLGDDLKNGTQNFIDPDGQPWQYVNHMKTRFAQDLADIGPKADFSLEQKLLSTSGQSLEFTGTQVLPKGSAGKLSPFASVQKRRVDRAIKGGDDQTVTTLLGDGAVHLLPVRLIRWAGEQRANGWIPVGTIGAAAHEYDAMVAWLRSADVLTPGQRNDMLNEYGRAVSNGAEETSKLLKSLEVDIAMMYTYRDAVDAGHITEFGGKAVHRMKTPNVDGLPRKSLARVAGNIFNDIEFQKARFAKRKAELKKDGDDFRYKPELLKKLEAEEKAFLDEVDAWTKQNDANRAAVAEWQAARDKKVRGQQNYGVSFDDMNGQSEIIDTTLVQSQIANAMPLMDWKRFSDVSQGLVKMKRSIEISGARNQRPVRVVTNKADKFTGDFKTRFDESVPKALKTATHFKYGVLATNRAFQQLFRPAILLAFKYTPRSLFDAVARNVAVLQGSMFDANTARAMGYNMQRRKNKLGLAAGSLPGAEYLGIDSTKRLNAKASQLEKVPLIRDIRKARKNQRDLREEGEYVNRYTTQHDALLADKEYRIQAGLDVPEEYDNVLKVLRDNIDQARAKADIESDILKNSSLLKSLLKQDPKTIKRFDQVNAKLDSVTSRKRRAGSYSFNIGDGRGGNVRIPGWADPENAVPSSVILSEVNAADTTATMVNMRQRYGGQNQTAAADPWANAVNGQVNFNDGAEQYWEAAVYLANNTLRSSDMAKLKLSGKSADEAFDFLNSKKGVDLKRYLTSTGQLSEGADKISYFNRFAGWYDSTKVDLDKVFPAGSELKDAVRRKIVEGKEITPRELANTFDEGIDAARPPLGGFGASDPSANRIQEMDTLTAKMQDFSQFAFKVLGANPETALGRHPMMNASYRRHMTEATQMHGTQYVEQNMGTVMRAALQRSVTDVKAVQYNVDRLSNAAWLFESIAPFFQAQLNTARVWGKIIAKDPSVLARAAQIWDAAEGVVEIPAGSIAQADVPIWSQLMAATGMDDAPDEYRFGVEPRNILSAIAPGNKGLDQMLGAGSSTDPEDSGNPTPSAASAVLSMFLPSLSGPWIQAPATAISQAMVSVEDPNFLQNLVMEGTEYLTPYGLAGNDLDIPDVLGLPTGTFASGFIPAWAQSIAAGTMDTDKAKVRTAAMYVDLLVEWNRGGAEGPEPTWEDAKAMAKGGLFLDAIAKMSLPFGGMDVITANSHITDEIRHWYNEGSSFEAVQRKLFQKYGQDYFPLLSSKTKRAAYVPATRKAVNFLKNNEDLIRDFVFTGNNSADDQVERLKVFLEFNPMLGAVDANGGYDAVAAAELKKMKIPGMSNEMTYYDVYEDGSGLFSKSERHRGQHFANGVDVEHRAMMNKLQRKLDADMKRAYSLGDKDDREAEVKKLEGAFFAEKQVLDSSKDLTYEQIASDFPAWENYKDQDDSANKLGLAMAKDILETDAGSKAFTNINPEFVASLNYFLEIRHSVQDAMSIAGQGGSDFYHSAAEERRKVIMDDYKDVTDRLTDSSTQFKSFFQTFFASELYRTDGRGTRTGPRATFAGDFIPRPWTALERKQRGYDEWSDQEKEVRSKVFKQTNFDETGAKRSKRMKNRQELQKRKREKEKQQRNAKRKQKAGR